MGASARRASTYPPMPARATTSGNPSTRTTRISESCFADALLGPRHSQHDGVAADRDRCTESCATLAVRNDASRTGTMRSSPQVPTEVMRSTRPDR